MKASEARELTNSRCPKPILDTILKIVEGAAVKGQSSIKVRSFGFGDGNLYHGEKYASTTQQEVIKSLRSLGYIVGIKAEEKQFVDIYLDISW